MEGSKKDRLKFWFGFLTVIIYSGSYMIASSLHYYRLTMIIMTTYLVGMSTYHYFRLRNQIISDPESSPLIIEKKLFFHKREYIVINSFLIVITITVVALYSVYDPIVFLIPIGLLFIILIIWLIINKKQKKIALQDKFN
jgi:hypothetical protein